MGRTVRSVFVVLAIITGVAQAVAAAPARVTANPVDEDVIKIYAYRKEPLVSLDEARPGFLAEVATAIVQDSELPVVVDVSPVAVLMKYSLIQSVGVAAIGTDADFSPTDLRGFQAIPLLETGGKIYHLYFNVQNPRSAALYDAAVAHLERIRADGTFEALLSEYGLR